MIPARTSQRLFGKTKLLIMQQDADPRHALVEQLPQVLQHGDLLVVNRSATLPSSFRRRVQRSGEELEIRLAAFQGSVATDLRHWAAFSFGAGDWRVPTEERGRPPFLQAGDRLEFGKDLTASILRVEHERLLQICFESPHLEQSLYSHGRPIQYSYLESPLYIWDQQTLFGGPPLSTEPPSAAFPFTWDLVLQLKRQGVDFATVLHGAGLSSTGSEELDRLLPLAEFYEVPAATVRKVQATQKRGNRIIALGTSALRALESAVQQGRLEPGKGMTQLRFGPEQRPSIVQGLITGMHELGTSHRSLLGAFLPEEELAQGFAAAEEGRYRSHEYGDICLVACHFDSLS